MYEGKLQIIMYHYVRDLKNSRYPEIRGLSTENFVKQINFLSEYFTILSPQEVTEAFYSDKRLPENACLLTFDDGYADHYDTVFPILMNRGYTAFFSMPGRVLKEKRLLDVNKIHYILAAADSQTLWMAFKMELTKQLKANQLPEFEVFWNKCNLVSRFDSPETIFIKRMLQVELPVTVRNEMVEYLYNKFVNIPESIMVNELYMSLEQMKCMKRAGMVFGIHGYEHAWLNRMTPLQAEKDIELALDTMDGIVDRNEWIMCYPYGSHSIEVEKIVQNKGAVLGLSTRARGCDVKTDGVFSLPRLDTNDFPPISNNYKKLQ